MSNSLLLFGLPIFLTFFAIWTFHMGKRIRERKADAFLKSWAVPSAKKPSRRSKFKRWIESRKKEKVPTTLTPGAMSTKAVLFEEPGKMLLIFGILPFLLLGVPTLIVLLLGRKMVGSAHIDWVRTFLLVVAIVIALVVIFLGTKHRDKLGNLKFGDKILKNILGGTAVLATAALFWWVIIPWGKKRNKEFYYDKNVPVTFAQNVSYGTPRRQLVLRDVSMDTVIIAPGRPIDITFIEPFYRMGLRIQIDIADKTSPDCFLLSTVHGTHRECPGEENEVPGSSVYSLEVIGNKPMKLVVSAIDPKVARPTRSEHTEKKHEEEKKEERDYRPTTPRYQAPRAQLAGMSS